MPGQDRLKVQSARVVSEVGLHWRLLAFEGVILMLFGATAIILPGIAIVGVDLLLGWLFLGAGALGLATTVMARGAPGFWWAIASALASIVAGVLLCVWPLHDFYAVSLVLAGFLVFDGIVMIMFGIAHKRQLSGRWPWLVVNGAVDLFLAPLILLVTFVTAAIWLLPEVIGIDMLFAGASLIAVALAAHRT